MIKYDLDQIDELLIARYKARTLTKVSATTVNKHLGVLSSLLHTAKRWGIIDRVPTIEWLKQPQPEWDFLDFEDADRLLEAALTEPEWHAFIMTGLKTGMRLGELLGLRWQDVDLVKGQIRLVRSATRRTVSTPKSGRSRTISMPGLLVETLIAHRRRTAW